MNEQRRKLAEYLQSLADETAAIKGRVARLELGLQKVVELLAPKAPTTERNRAE